MKLRIPFLLAGVVFLLPSLALAEVMDKIILPWAPSLLLATILILCGCIYLAALNFRFANIASIVISLVWLGFRFFFYEWFAFDLGGALRRELGNTKYLYATVLFIESLLPLLVTIIILLLKRKNRRLPIKNKSKI